jgi:hypothetical protein
LDAEASMTRSLSETSELILRGGDPGDPELAPPATCRAFQTLARFRLLQSAYPTGCSGDRELPMQVVSISRSV